MLEREALSVAASLDLSKIAGMPPGFRLAITPEETIAAMDALPADARTEAVRLLRHRSRVIPVLNDATGEIGFLGKESDGWYVHVYAREPDGEDIHGA